MCYRYYFIIKAQFACGTQHTKRFHTSQFTFRDLHAAFLLRLPMQRSRDPAFVKCHRHQCAFKYVRCSRYDLDRFFFACIDLTHHQLICIRVLFYFLDLSDYHAFHFFTEMLAGFQVGTGHDHSVTELLIGNIYIDIIIQPLDWN